MKKTILSVCISLSAFGAYAQTKPATAAKKPVATAVKKPLATTAKKPVATATVLKNNLDSASYGFGLSMSTGLKGSGIGPINYDLFVKGLKDGFNGAKSTLTKDQADEAIQNLFEKANRDKFKGNISEGKNFLEKNKAVAGVKTTASGLQYQVVTAGNGAKPTVQDTVEVHYKGTLINGKQFDSSYDSGQSLELSVGGVIAGWTEGLQLMTAGSKYRFFIPYNLAYGERGAGEDIPPFSTLIFDVELLKVKGK
jgi:FKBP-type peptidyl-prolyl cis-trans isomerase